MNEMSRRELLQLAAAAGASAFGGAGCARFLTPLAEVSVPCPTNGVVSLPLASFPELAKTGGALLVRPAGVRADQQGQPAVTPFIVAKAGDYASGPGYFATGAVCPHAQCDLTYVPEDRELECPCHASRFAPADGAVLNPPARAALPTFPATFDAVTGQVLVSLLAGDGTFPALTNGTLTLEVSRYPELATPPTALIGIPDGLGTPIAVIRTGPSAFTVLTAVCTHQSCTVAFDAGSATLQCPCHASAFDLAGNVLQPPAPRPLRSYPSSFDGATLTMRFETPIACAG